MNLSVSTQEAAQLLHVHVSSIKRWCDDEVLACGYTLGGHRRIPLEALLEVSRQKSLSCLLLDLPAYEAKVWRGVNQVWAGDGYDTLIGLLYGWLLAGEERLPGALLRLLLDLDIPLAALLDHLLAPALRRVGEAWQDHTLNVGDEHRMTEIVRDTLYDLLLTFDRPSTKNGDAPPVALVGCGRTELHDLGALMVRLVLTANAWRVVYLGKQVPTEEFAQQQVEQGGALVCVSFAPPQGVPNAVRLVRMLGRLYDEAHPYRLALGGSGVQGGQDRLPSSTPFLSLNCFEDTTTFADWLTELRST